MSMDPNAQYYEVGETAPVSGADAAGAGASMAMGANPWLIAGMVGLKALEAHKARKERERMERYQAQVNTSNRMQSALSKLSNIGASLKL